MRHATTRPTTGRADDQRAVATATVQVVLECLSGRRSLEQLESRLPRGAVRVRSVRRTRFPGRLRHLTVTNPVPGVCEAVGTVVLDGRLGAVAVSLRRSDDRWTVRSIELG